MHFEVGEVEQCALRLVPAVRFFEFDCPLGEQVVEAADVVVQSRRAPHRSPHLAERLKRLVGARPFAGAHLGGAQEFVPPAGLATRQAAHLRDGPLRRLGLVIVDRFDRLESALRLLEEILH